MPSRFTGPGFREFREKLERQLEAMKAGITIDDVFTPKYMRQHSAFSSLEELIAAGGLPTTTAEFEELEEQKVDAVIRAHTQFGTWNEFQTDAFEAYVARTLGLKRRS